MPVSARLSRKLRESLGEESGDDLVTWMVKVEERRLELQDVVSAWRVTTDSRFAALEARMDLRFSEQQRLVESEFEGMRHAIAALETRFERRFGDLIKWSFVFWCGAIAAVAMLARALR